jgi:hypothetical protein
MSEWDSWGADKGGLDMIVVIVGGPRPLLSALWGRLSNKSRLLAGDRAVHRCHQQVPCNEDGRGLGARGREGVEAYQFQVRETSRWTLTPGTKKEAATGFGRQVDTELLYSSTWTDRSLQLNNSHCRQTGRQTKSQGISGQKPNKQGARRLMIGPRGQRMMVWNLRGPKSRGPRDGGRPPPSFW